MNIWQTSRFILRTTSGWVCKTWSRFNEKNKIITIFCSLSIMSVMIPTLLSAQDNRINKILLQVSGITHEDYSLALEKKSLDMYDLYALAVRNTEKMKIASENIIQAEARKQQAVGSFFPKISLRGTKVLPNDSYTKDLMPFMKTGVSLYGRQPIITGFDEWARFKGSKHDLKLQSFGIKSTATKLLYEVAYGYYRVLQLEKNLSNKKSILQLYKQNISELGRRVWLGKSRQGDLLRVSSEMYKLEAVIQSLGNELERARLNLSTITGVSIEKRTVRDVIVLPEPRNVEKDTDFYIKKRWDVITAQEDVQLAETRLLAAKAGHLPSIYLEGTYRLYQKQKGSGPDYYLALGAELPIFSGLITTAKIKEASSGLSQSRLQYQRAIRIARQDILDSYQGYMTSKQEVEAYQKAYNSAENNYNVSLRDYRLNLVTILEVLSALTSLQNAKDDYDRIILQNKLNRISLGIAINEFSEQNIRMLKMETIKENNNKKNP